MPKPPAADISDLLLCALRSQQLYCLFLSLLVDQEKGVLIREMQTPNTASPVRAHKGTRSVSSAAALQSSPRKSDTTNNSTKGTSDEDKKRATDSSYYYSSNTLNRSRPNLSQRTTSGLSAHHHHPPAAHESESDSGYRSEDRPASVRKLFAPPASSGAPAGSAKKYSDNAAGTNAMTVETETVATVASVAVGTSAQGSVRSSKSAVRFLFYNAAFFF